MFLGRFVLFNFLIEWKFAKIQNGPRTSLIGSEWAVWWEKKTRYQKSRETVPLSFSSHSSQALEFLESRHEAELPFNEVIASQIILCHMSRGEVAEAESILHILNRQEVPNKLPQLFQNLS